MAPPFHPSRSTSLARRTLTASIMLICLTMAGSNLVAAFAGTPELVGSAMVTSDLVESVNAGESTVLLSLSSMDVKESVINEINAIVPGSVEDVYSALPILSVKNVNPENIAALSSVPGVSTLEPDREMQQLSTFNTAEYLDWIKGTDVTSNGIVIRGQSQVFGVIDTGININQPDFKDETGKSRVVAQACFGDSADIAPCPGSNDPN